MFNPWMNLTCDMMLAQFEAQRVMGLRLAKLARGGAAADNESRLMVTEKLMAAAEAARALAVGKSPHSVVRRYRTIMRANAKRLNRR
jgi:hypothetical protein